jgi:uncharacterized protein (TIGR02171 family)
MVLIHASGQSFLQGSNDTLAKSDEKPAFKVTFTYDFYMDTIEVTQELYQKVTAKIISDSAANFCPNCPVYSVTWFDALLFCNKRSKLRGLDTVYSFSSIDSTQSGRVYSLENLRINYNKLGYRLPTESEWEYCAKVGALPEFSGNSLSDSTAVKYAWYNANSGGSPHPGAQLQPNRCGIYDLAGNILEWTNDAKGPYPNVPVNDPLGAFALEDCERVVKGGAYSQSILNLLPINRSDAYPVLPSAALQYLGFRCVVGEINNGSYYDRDGGAISNPTFYVTKSNFQNLVGSSHVKVAFVDIEGAQRILTYIDFISNNFHVYRYSGNTDVHAPMISPNGEWVAFCTGDMGGQGGSSVSIQRLDSLGSGFTQLSDKNAFFPRWWVDPILKDTFIVYASSAIFNTSLLWNSTKTFIQKISGGKPIGDPSSIANNGSYYGGLSYSGKYLATGYPRLLVQDLQLGTVQQLFLGPQNGKGPGDTSQVCNVSITPDSANESRVIFLDFGCNKGSTVVGATYGVHQILFMSDYSGKVLNWFWCPTSESSWDHPKWSNNYRFAIAIGVGADGSHHSIYVVDLLKNASNEILSGQNMQQPCLWMDKGDFSLPPGGICLDSIGRYNDPPTTFGQAELAQKFYLFWHSYDSIEIAFTGSSMVRYGIDPVEIKNYISLNMGVGGGDFLCARSLIENYILTNCKKIKLIAVSLDMGWLANPDADFSWKECPSQSVGYNYDSNHQFWQSGLPNGFVDFVGESDGTFNKSGYNAAQSNGWGDNPPTVLGRTDWDCQDSNFVKNMSHISEFINELALRGIYVLFVNFPVSPNYRGTSSYSTWGPSWITAAAILDQVRALESQYSNFHFYDANLNGNHDYTQAEFYDENHLSGAGATKLTGRLNSVIDSILNQK